MYTHTHNAYMHTHAHTHTMHTCTCTHIMHTCTRRGERRLIGLQDCWGRGRGGLIFSQIKYESGGGGGGGGGGSLTIRHQTRRIDQPPWLQACIHTHIHTHAYSHIHTHNAHINRHAHVCMCIASSCVYMCAYTYTHTQKYCWTANTLREKCAFFAIGTTQKSCIAFLNVYSQL